MSSAYGNCSCRLFAGNAVCYGGAAVFWISFFTPLGMDFIYLFLGLLGVGTILAILGLITGLVGQFSTPRSANASQGIVLNASSLLLAAALAVATAM